MEKKVADLRSGLVVMIVCALLYFWAIPAQIRYNGQADLNPDFFPRLLVICGGICGAILALTSAAGLKKAGRLNVTLFRSPEARVNLKSYMRHALFLASALAYLFVVGYLGFVLASVLYLVFLLLYFGHTRIHWCLLESVLFVAAVYLVFSLAFKISFPEGFLGF